MISVLEEPIWKTRYGLEEDFLKGYEIYHGHHRIVCCCAFGFETIPANILIDRHPGTCKFAKFDKVLKEISH